MRSVILPVEPGQLRVPLDEPSVHQLNQQNCERKIEYGLREKLIGEVPRFLCDLPGLLLKFPRPPYSLPRQLTGGTPVVELKWPTFPEDPDNYMHMATLQGLQRRARQERAFHDDYLGLLGMTPIPGWTTYETCLLAPGCPARLISTPDTIRSDPRGGPAKNSNRHLFWTFRIECDAIWFRQCA